MTLRLDLFKTVIRLEFYITKHTQNHIIRRETENNSENFKLAHALILGLQ